MAEGDSFHVADQEIIDKPGRHELDYEELGTQIRNELLKAATAKNQDSEKVKKLYELDDMFDEISGETSRKAMKQKVTHFFSPWNNKLNNKIVKFKQEYEEYVKKKYSGSVEPVKSNEFECDIQERDRSNNCPVLDVVIPRKNDEKYIKECLLSSSYKENISIISIVGTGGIGKTQLAQCVFDDDSVSKHFELKLWVLVSHTSNFETIIKKIVESARDAKLEELGIDILENRLETVIYEKKFLLVLDDVSVVDYKKWSKLKELLRRGARGSKILTTTRSSKVANIASTVRPHVLGSLSDEDSKSLFKEIVSLKETELEKVKQIVQNIVKKCGGNPLAIKMVAGILSNTPLDKWSDTIKIEGKLSDGETPILWATRLSYDLLPPNLKFCLAFCSLFPVDYEIDVKALVQMWIGQGYIVSSNSEKCLEDIGHGYFKEFVWRSFFEEVKDKLGNIKHVKMSISMHDFVTSFAGAETSMVDLQVENVTDSTHHISLDFHLESSWNAPNELFKAKSLRTFLLPSQKFGSSNETTWKQIKYKKVFSKFRRLRVFDVHNIGIDELPSYIGSLRHLRYLDLSENDELKKLPNSVTRLQNLQVLKLSGCEQLMELPKGISKLVNLRHVHCDGCWNLAYMPRGIGNLTSLQTLTWFVIAANSSDSDDIGDLKELSSLNNLRGSLEIRNLKEIPEHEATNLLKKKDLESLALHWNQDGDDFSGSSISQVKSCESLQIYPNLKKLILCEYGGLNFPTWLSSFSNLVDIQIKDCEKCRILPPMDQMLNLKYVKIQNLSMLEYMELSDQVGKGASIFQSLKELYILGCPNLMGWRLRMNVSHFSCLSKLEICDCPQLTIMPTFPNLEEKLSLENASLEPLKQTMKMQNSSSSSLFPSSSHDPLPLSKLKTLWIVTIMDPEPLQKEWMQNLISLQELKIKYCPNITVLPETMHCLTSLKRLDISGCPRLNRKGGKLKGWDWQNVDCIPNIQLDGERMEWEHRELQDNKQTFIATPLVLSCTKLVRVARIENVEYLPEEWLQNLTSLQVLHLVRCKGLKSLPQVIRNLTSLRELSIDMCPELATNIKNQITNWRSPLQILVDGQIIYP